MSKFEKGSVNEEILNTELIGNFEVGNVNLDLAAILQHHGLQIDLKDAYEDHERLLHHTSIIIENPEERDIFNKIKNDPEYEIIELASSGNLVFEEILYTRLNSSNMDESSKAKIKALFYDRAETYLRGWISYTSKYKDLKMKAESLKNKKNASLMLNDGTLLNEFNHEEMNNMIEQIALKYLPLEEHS